MIACDVDNPLCGCRGCSNVFARQKGADDKAVAKMDKWLLHYAELTRQTFDRLGIPREVNMDYPGAGAAGGLGFAFTVLLNGKIVSGADLILDKTGITLDFPVAFDWEEYDKMAAKGMDYGSLNHLWFCFADEMNKRGYDVMLYASVWYLSHCWNPYGHPVWAAHYTAHTSYKGDYILWQRTSVGIINGIEGVVDLDVYYPGGH
jgi:hypothetical protein